MGRVRRGASVALVGLAAACLCLGASGVAPAAAAGVEGLGWVVGGSIEAGGMYSFGNTDSSKYNNYRDMDNGFLGELILKGEKKDSPYYFEIGAKNPARTDQAYEFAFGRFGMFYLDGEWNQTPIVLSNNARTIYQLSGDTFYLPSAQRTSIAAAFTGPPGPTTVAGRVNINNTINRLLWPVDLGYNSNVGRVDLKYTPLDGLRFDFGYENITQQGNRAASAQMAGSTSGPINELAIPIETSTNQFKFGAEYARANWGLQFKYLGSFFNNENTGYTWQNPAVVTSTPAANAFDRFAAAPDNMANTFSLTGTASLPWRTRINATAAYTMLRQNQAFEYSTANPTLLRQNTDDAGNGSADAKSNLALANIVVTSRPIDSLTATARYRYFEYQNDMPFHEFSDVYVSGGTTRVAAETENASYTTQSAGFDLGWRPNRTVSLKGGYEYVYWRRSNFGEQQDPGSDANSTFTTTENIARFAADVTPVDWFLGRLTYTWGSRTIENYVQAPVAELPQSWKYDYAPRIRNKVDTLFQFTPWETFSPSFSIGYAKDDYYQNQFGLTGNDYFSAGTNLDWSPVSWLTLSFDYTYEQYQYQMTSRYLVGGTFPGIPANTWQSRSKDEFQNVGLNATVNIIPKKFDVTMGYVVNFGYTTFQNTNLNLSAATAVPQAYPYAWDRVLNVLQTFRILGRYRVTDQLSVRGGFAYERYNEKDWARDPMAPFMGFYDSDRPNGPAIAAASQSVWLGATQPNYEAYIFSALVRYAF